MSTETLDFAMNFEQNEQSDADKKLLVVFYRDIIKNEPKSIDAGRPIFDEIDLVKIISPGSRDSFIGDATEEYKQRFPTQWARYKAGRDQQIGNGTPLNQLPWLSIAQIAEFNALGCHTIEHLVGMPDSVSQKFMGHLQIKTRAQAYLDAAKEMGPSLRMQEELHRKDQQIAELTATVNKMVEAMKAQQEKASA